MRASRVMSITSRVLFVAALAATTYLSLTPSPPSTSIGWDKIPHMIAYATLVFLLLLSFKSERSIHSRVVIAVAAVMAWGIVIEFVQRTTGRTFEVGDIVANGVGAVVGLFLGIAVIRLTEPSARTER